MMLARLAIALFGLLCAFPAQAQTSPIVCDSTAIYDASSSGATKLIDTSSGRTIYVCGYTFFSAGTVNVKLVYGSGATCGTGTTDMLPAFQLTTQTGIADNSPQYRGLRAPNGNNVCINTSAGAAVQAIVYYARR